MSSRLQAIGLLLALAVTIWQGQVWGQVYMRVVASDEEFREALRVAAQGSLDTVVLSSSVSVLRLNQSAWTNVSFSIPNSLTIAGQYNGDSRQILDLAFLSNKLSLGPGAVFTFANLVVYGGLTRAGTHPEILGTSGGAQVEVSHSVLYRLACVPLSATMPVILAQKRPIPGVNKAQLLNTFCFANASEPTVNNCWSPAIYFEDFAVNITNPFDHSNYTLKLSDTDIVCKSAVNLTCVLQKGADACVLEELARQQVLLNGTDSSPPVSAPSPMPTPSPPPPLRQVVASDAELRAALSLAEQGQVTHIQLSPTISTLKLDTSAWADITFSLNSSVVIEGVGDVAARQILDLALLSGKIRMAAGTSLGFQNLLLYRTNTRAGPYPEILGPSTGASVDAAGCVVIQLACQGLPQTFPSLQMAPRPSMYPGANNVSIVDQLCFANASAPAAPTCWQPVLGLTDFGLTIVPTTLNGGGAFFMHFTDSAVVCLVPVDQACINLKGPDVCVYEEIQRQEGMLSGNTDSGGSSPPVGAIVGGVVGGVGGVAVVVAVAVAFLIRHRRQEAALRMRYSHESADMAFGHISKFNSQRHSHNTSHSHKGLHTGRGASGSGPLGMGAGMLGEDGQASWTPTAPLGSAQDSQEGRVQQPETHITRIEAMKAALACSLAASKTCADSAAGGTPLRPNSVGMHGRQQTMDGTTGRPHSAGFGPVGTSGSMGHGGNTSTQSGGNDGSGADGVGVMRLGQDQLGDEITLITLIGEGTYGKCFKARWRGALVCVKTMILPANMSGQEKREKMAIMEAAISSTLSHPNIVQTFTYAVIPIKQTLKTELQTQELPQATTSQPSGAHQRLHQLHPSVEPAPEAAHISSPRGDNALREGLGGLGVVHEAADEGGPLSRLSRHTPGAPTMQTPLDDTVCLPRGTAIEVARPLFAPSPVTSASSKELTAAMALELNGSGRGGAGAAGSTSVDAAHLQAAQNFSTARGSSSNARGSSGNITAAAAAAVARGLVAEAAPVPTAAAAAPSRQGTGGLLGSYLDGSGVQPQQAIVLGTPGSAAAAAARPTSAPAPDQIRRTFSIDASLSAGKGGGPTGTSRFATAPTMQQAGSSVTASTAPGGSTRGPPGTPRSPSGIRSGSKPPSLGNPAAGNAGRAQSMPQGPQDTSVLLIVAEPSQTMNAAKAVEGGRAAAAAAALMNTSRLGGGPDTTGEPSSASSSEHVHNVEVRLVLEWCDRGSLRDALDGGAFLLPPGSPAPGALPMSPSTGAGRPKSSTHATVGPPTHTAPPPPILLTSGSISHLPCLNYLAVLETAADIARAMAHLHSMGIVHSDLKARNVLLKTTGGDARGACAKVCDFGLSLHMAAGETHVSEVFQGTLTHMSPEVMLAGRVGLASDVYAFGVLLWELFTGGHAFRGMPRALLGHAVALRGTRPEFPAHAPPRFVALATACWGHDPNERPSMAAVSHTLDDLRAEFGWDVEPPPLSYAAPGAPSTGQQLVRLVPCYERKLSHVAVAAKESVQKLQGPIVRAPSMPVIMGGGAGSDGGGAQQGAGGALLASGAQRPARMGILAALGADLDSTMGEGEGGAGGGANEGGHAGGHHHAGMGGSSDGGSQYAPVTRIPSHTLAMSSTTSMDEYEADEEDDEEGDDDDYTYYENGSYGEGGSPVQPGAQEQADGQPQEAAGGVENGGECGAVPSPAAPSPQRTLSRRASRRESRTSRHRASHPRVSQPGEGAGADPESAAAAGGDGGGGERDEASRLRKLRRQSSHSQGAPRGSARTSRRSAGAYAGQGQASGPVSGGVGSGTVYEATATQVNVASGPGSLTGCSVGGGEGEGEGSPYGGGSPAPGSRALRNTKSFGSRKSRGVMFADEQRLLAAAEAAAGDGAGAGDMPTRGSGPDPADVDGAGVSGSGSRGGLASGTGGSSTNGSPSDTPRKLTLVAGPRGEQPERVHSRALGSALRTERASSTDPLNGATTTAPVLPVAATLRPSSGLAATSGLTGGNSDAGLPARPSQSRVAFAHPDVAEPGQSAGQ